MRIREIFDGFTGWKLCLHHAVYNLFLADGFRHHVDDVDLLQRLQSALTPALFVPTTHLSIIDDHAFRVAVPPAWNSLPPDVTSSPSLLTFKCHLKTVLFARSYSWCFACGWQFYLAVIHIPIVFLSGVLAVFWLCNHNQFMMMMMMNGASSFTERTTGSKSFLVYLSIF